MYKIAIIYTPHLRRIMAALAVVVALSIFVYGVFLLEAVGNTAERTALERQVRTLSSKVSGLEQAYLIKTREMTLERAQTLGFVVPSEVVTVFATKDVHSLSLGR
jgi:heme/copper-type cytochrome/quinol oxidase subunit 2